METSLLQVTTTLPSEVQAQELGQILVEERLAACAQTSGPIVSHFFWKDEYCEETEWRLTLKTQASRYGDLEERIKELHPYELPQIIAVKIAQAYLPYEDWVKHNTED
ncbi:MAG: hypothetical protein A2508_02260 [Candidatus Lambdaproteobacteria bacterium RIFOXYD12_FULL_49_8]|uniref:Divalent-cation tolerance protein CutA n=1 Tax=Candidatus Lambdaproteobacteria bacterium RIFOXYD2_FULL_50_16 TaxID=1817772 RepID=A0A1F6GGQ2_9PROT|nr:MAG: hypothetical protein A2508_02260 [Candidatus Lambdaproteobacteria bacterium RIFOXYD12_FULL_49_8]OGG97287.1 MAG: hypothetical protein A2527_10660 [Candidatus Lambdaproteobacteria bacterium RIFOXYD2_FULL_50_16]